MRIFLNMGMVSLLFMLAVSSIPLHSSGGPCNLASGDNVTVTSITATGATEVTLPDGEANIRHFVTPKGGSQGKVTFTIVLSHNTPANRAEIEWVGATEDPNNPLKATVSKGTTAKHVVKIKVDGGTCVLEELHVWVVWADFTKFNNTGPKDNDSGVHPPSYGTSSGLQNGVLIQVTLSPVGIEAFPANTISYDIKRTTGWKLWERDDGETWVSYAGDGPGKDDDSDDTDEDLTPSAERHIYGHDHPGLNHNIAFADEAVLKANFIEFVQIKIGEGSFVMCSDDYEWYSIVWVENDGSGEFIRKASATNEIEEGSIDIGEPAE